MIVTKAHCPKVHRKMMLIFDNEFVYLISAVMNDVDF